MHRHTRARRGLVSRAGNALLTVAALGGAVCIVLVPLALAFHVTLIMFKTGSMGPTIPAGSLAVVREIPASQVHVGDVVTVDRDALPPVTHRVTSVTAAPDGARVITMRGDANPADDPYPYTVTHVRVVMFSVPQLAYAVRSVSNPLVMGTVTVGSALLVTWAFWPKGERAPRLRRSARHAEPQHAMTGPLAVVALLAATAAVLGSAPPARAAETEDVVHGEYLTLTSVGDKTQMSHLLPGVPVPWQIGVTAHPSQPGTVHIALSARGSLVTRPDGLQVTISVCRVRWTHGTCATGATAVGGPGPASQVLARQLAVATMRSDEQRWVLVEAAIPADPAQLPSGTATIVISANGTGDAVSTDRQLGPQPGATGSNLRTPLLAGLGALVAGLGLTVVARAVGIRQHRRDEAAS